MENKDPALLIGVDGGGSKTVVLLADSEGHVLGRGMGGPSNYQVVGQQAAGAALSQTVRAAFAEANLEPRAPAAICLGLSGVDRPADQAVIQAWVNEEMPGTPAAIVNDAELVLAAGTPEGWGVALICGTGSIAYGRMPGGQAARAGGWGYLLGDEGSGYAIGMAALRAVARASDGRASQTTLTRSILEHWSLAAPQELIGHIYQRRIPTQEIAALARLVDMAASDQDRVAQNILQEAGHELALAVSAVVQRLGMHGTVPCAQAGSVIVKGQFIARTFLDAAVALGLRLDPVTPVTEPAQGALRLARALAQRQR